MEKDDPLFLNVIQIATSIHNINKKSEKDLGLSLVQWCLLEQLIDMPGTSAFDLARAVGVHPSTLTQTLKRLERKGLIFISADPQDSRRKQVSLTKAGKVALEEIRRKTGKWSRRLRSAGSELMRVRHLLGELEKSP